MSIDVKIEIPLDTAVAILEAVNHSDHSKAIEVASTKTSEAVVNAVKSLPYEIKAKRDIPNITAKRVTSTGKPGGKVRAKGITVQVNTLTGKTFFIDNIMSNARASHLASRIQDVEGIPPDQQRLIFKGKQILGNVDEDDVIDIRLDEAS